MSGLSSNSADGASVAQQAMDQIGIASYLARKRGHPRVRNALHIIASDPQDVDTIGEITKATLSWLTRTSTYKRTLRNKDEFHAPPIQVCRGEIPIGTVTDVIEMRRYVFELFLAELQQSMLITGRVGSGKTTLIYILLRSIIAQNVPFWVIDFKRDYRHLMRITNDVMIYRATNIDWNPLEAPPGADTLRWMHTFCDVFSDIFIPSGANASKFLLMDIIYQLFDVRGVLQGSGDYPTIKDLDGRLDPNTYEKKPAGDVVQKMRVLRNKTLPLVHAIDRGKLSQRTISLQDLVDEKVVFELDGLAAEHQAFFLIMLLMWMFTYRIERGERGARLRHVFVFDEAKLAFPRTSNQTVDSKTQFLCMAREFGEGIIAADQMPEWVSDGLKSNVYTTIAFSQASANNARAMGGALNLSEGQRGALIELPVGQAIVRLAGRYTKPFRLDVPDTVPPKDVTDKQIDAHMASLRATQGRRAEAQRSSQGHRPVNSGPSASSEQHGGRQASEDAIRLSSLGADISDTQYRMLIDIRDHPYDSVTQRYDRLSINPRTGTVPIRDLVKRVFLKEVSVPLGGRGRPAKLLEFTNKATERVGSQKIGKGIGGLGHCFMQHHVYHFNLRLGHRAKIEAYLNGKAVDVGVWKHGEAVAYEIAMNPYHEVQNLIKDFEAGWDRVVVVWCDRAVKKNVLTRFKQLPQYLDWKDKIDFISAREFVSD